MDAKTAKPEPIVSTPSRVLAFDGTIVREGPQAVAVETPVQVTFADVPFAVMMLTPADLVDFAYGFSLTEGMIEKASDIRDVEVRDAEDGLVLRISIVGEKLRKHLARQRAMTGRTGCGVCGIDDLEALRRAEAVGGEGGKLAIRAIERGLAALGERQNLNRQTRAVHAAAWADLSGSIIEIREDVGRHNALDKLIGALIQAQVDPIAGFVIITSRCSFEMVEKTAVFGARALVAISAPTSFAVARAKALGIMLAAIARRDTLTVFHGTERLGAEDVTGDFTPD